MCGGQMPDITPAQIIAIVGSVIGAAIAFGVHVSKEQQDAILAVTGAIAAVLIGSDAHLRGRRSHAQALRYAADRHVEAAAAGAGVTAGADQSPVVPAAPPTTP